MKIGNNEKECVSVTVGIQKHIFEQINVSPGQEAVQVSRNNWTIKALIEKLRRSEAEGGLDGAQ